MSITNLHYEKFTKDLRKTNNNDMVSVFKLARLYKIIPNKEWLSICRRLSGIKTKDDFEIIWAYINRMEKRHDGSKNDSKYLEWEHTKDRFFFFDSLIHFLYCVIGF